MEKFDAIFDLAATRHGGEDAFREKLASHYYGKDLDSVAALKSDARWLAEFTLRVFQSGFSWKVVENKLGGFEAAFWKLYPGKCTEIDMDNMERLTADKAIVRNPVKIKTVAPKARMIIEMSERAGSADKFIRGWASEDYIGLLAHLQKHGSHLGANTASYALRFSGVPSFILSSDVTAALIHAGIIDKPATSRTAKRACRTPLISGMKRAAKT